MKQEKGITLIALIITIIVLLILAVVAINSVNGDGIISKAKIAKKNYQDAQTEEQSTLDKYMDILNNINPDEAESDNDEFYYYEGGEYSGGYYLRVYVYIDSLWKFYSISSNKPLLDNNGNPLFEDFEYWDYETNIGNEKITKNDERFVNLCNLGLNINDYADVVFCETRSNSDSQYEIDHWFYCFSSDYSKMYNYGDNIYDFRAECEGYDRVTNVNLINKVKNSKAKLQEFSS